MMVELGGKISQTRERGHENHITIWFEGVDDPLMVSKEIYKGMGSPNPGTTWKITITPMEESE